MKQLVLLVSSDHVSKHGQDRARALLQATGADFTEIDAADPKNSEYREYLIQISRLPSEFPQLFLIKQATKTSFLGTWEDVEAINDCSSLPQDILASKPELSTWDRLVKEGDEVLFLMSSTAMNRETLQRQERALLLFQARRIAHTSIDGADPNNKSNRNKLFEISGIGAQYPQFFIKRSAYHTFFLGDAEDMERINEASRLPSYVLEANPSIITWEKVLG